MAALVASIYRGISYRGAEGQWAWILHRASGLGIVLFLYMHIVSIFIAALGPEPYAWVHKYLYTSPPAKLLEIFLGFGVIFHALNGMRIIIIDFFPALGKYQRTVVRIELVIVVIILIPYAIATLGSGF